MAVKSKWIARAKRILWGYDERLAQPDGTRRRVRAFEFDTEDEAREALVMIKRRLREQKYGLVPRQSAPLLVSLIKKRLAFITDPAEQRLQRRVLVYWLSLLDKRVKRDATVDELASAVRITDIKTPQIQLYVVARRADGVTPAGIDRELNVISATLRQVAEFFPELEQWRPPKTPRPKRSKRRRERVITDVEYCALVDHLSRPRQLDESGLIYTARLRVGQILRFAMLTGLRPKELYALRWTDVEWAENRIVVRATKSERRLDSTRFVPLTPTVAALLRERQSATRHPFVFTRSGKPHNNLYRILRRACAALEIPYSKKVHNGLELYCARHTFTTRLLQAGSDLATVGAITGHADKTLILHYSHITPESSALAAAKMEQIEARRLGHDKDTKT